PPLSGCRTRSAARKRSRPDAFISRHSGKRTTHHHHSPRKSMRSTLAQRTTLRNPLSAPALAPLKRLGIGAGVAYGAAGLAVLVLLWSLCTRMLETSVPLAASLAPGATFDSLYHLVFSGELNSHTLMSLRRVLVGLALALVIGVPIGLAVGSSRLVESMSGQIGRASW